MVLRFAARASAWVFSCERVHMRMWWYCAGALPNYASIRIDHVYKITVSLSLNQPQLSSIVRVVPESYP